MKQISKYDYKKAISRISEEGFEHLYENWLDRNMLRYSEAVHRMERAGILVKQCRRNVIYVMKSELGENIHDENEFFWTPALDTPQILGSDTPTDTDTLYLTSENSSDEVQESEYEGDSDNASDMTEYTLASSNSSRSPQGNESNVSEFSGSEGNRDSDIEMSD